MPIDLTATIFEQILDNMVETLSRVRLVDGYFNDFIAVREEQFGNSPRDGLVVVVAGDPIPEPPPFGFEQFLRPVGVICYAIEPEDSVRNISTRLESMAADVRKALSIDLHRGGNAMNTKLDIAQARDEFFKTESPYSVLVKPHIQYRHLRGNPYAWH